MRASTAIIAVLSAGWMFAGAASAQLPTAGDRDPSGRIYTRLVVTITGESGAFGQPASNLRFLVVTADGDRVSLRTNDAGVASTWLFPGSYRFVTPDPYPWDGNEYTWDAVVAIRAGTGPIRLSQANASKIVALTPAAPGTAQPRTAEQRSAPRPSQLGPSDDSVRSVTQGFFLAPHLLGVSLEFEDEPIETGGGFGVTAGYGFTRMLAGFVTIDLAKVDISDPDFEGDYALGHADLGLRLNFRTQTKKAIPYADAAVSARLAQTTIEGVDIELSGAAFTIGGGLNYYFQPSLAFDVGLSYSFGNFDKVEIDGDDIPIDDFSATGARFKLCQLVSLRWQRENC